MSVGDLTLLLLLGSALGAAWLLRNRLVAERGRHARQLAEERERHAAALHEQTSRMEAMLDGMIEGLVVLDSRGRIARANRAAEAMFSFSRMMIGGTLLQAIRNHEVAALAARAAAGATAIEHEVRLEGPKSRILQVSAVALRDANGATTGAVLVFHEVTRLRELEAMRQDFVANVSHELRTPLSMIKSAAETLIDGGRNDPAITTRFLEIIDKHASRLTLLIDDLLLLARLDSGRIELKFQPVKLRTAVQEALQDAALLARARNVTLVNEVPEELAAQGDAERLHQVLTNLVDNAIKYGRADGRVVVTGRAAVDRVEFAVRDDGPGIPPDALARIFERFYRVDKARSREQGGTGLGLAIVKNVVQAHNGDVRVESTPGTGTTFIISLPAAR
jgi:two-component system phosphate regulon sensor histidine kinase PhoR